MFQCNLSRIAPFKPCKTCPRGKPHKCDLPLVKADDGDYMRTETVLCLDCSKVRVYMVEVNS